MNYRPIAFLLLFVFSFACPIAHATLIGDTITISHDIPFLGAHLDSFNVLVQTGTGDQVNIEGAYIVNPDSTSINVSFSQSLTWASQTFNGLAVTGIDDSLLGFTITTNIVGWTDSRFVFDTHSFSANWSGLP